MSSKRPHSPAAGRFRRSLWRLFLLSLAAAVVLPMLGLGIAVAQEKKADKKTGTQDEKDIPEPEEIDLDTRDGVLLRATFFPGTEKKNTVPVVLLHMWKGSRSDYSELAYFLQQQGHAVLVPDLRGHGDSTRVRNTTRPLDGATMPTAAFGCMVTHDMETIRSFLLKKNDAGELNIEKLCLVGAELGAAVAMDWARLDWSWPPLATGKQGQNVKALVLISPQWSIRGLQLKPALAHPRVRRDLSVMIVVGKERSRSVRDARRLYSALKRYHRDPPPGKPDQRDLFYAPLETSLQGTKMLDVKGLNLAWYIAQFIDRRLVKQSFPWKDRSRSP